MPPQPPSSHQDNTSSPSSPVPFSWWFLTGGTAGSYYGDGGRRRPPSRAEFLRRASERKAAHRWAQAQAEAAEAVAARKRAAVAELEEEHGPLGLLGSGTTSTPKTPGRGMPKREELMAQFGPSSGVRAGRGGRGAIPAQRADELVEKARAAQMSDRAEPPATVPASDLPDAASGVQEVASIHSTAEEGDDPDGTRSPHPGENGTESDPHDVTRIQEEDGNTEAATARAATGPGPGEGPEERQPPETPPPSEGTEGARKAPSTHDGAQT